MLIVLMLLSTGAAVFQSFRVRTLERQLEPWQSTPALKAFWKNFFDIHNGTAIVLADTSFAVAQDLSGYTLTLDDYLRMRYVPGGDKSPALLADGRAANVLYSLLSSRNSGSIGDFRTAQRIVELRPGLSTMRIRFARDYSGEALRHDSSILIGSMRSNPWVEPFQDKLFYRMGPSPDGQGIVVQLHDPQAHERPAYATSSGANRTDGFCIVAFVSNLSGDGKTLIIAGTDSQATEAGGDFMTQEQNLAPLLKTMKSTGFTPFQLLLRTSRVAGAPLRTEIVSFRMGEVS